MRLIAFDTETYPIGMFPATGKSKVTVNPVPKMVCLTAYDGHRTEILRGPQAVEQFVYWLRQPNTHLIAHNLTFDALVMARAAKEYSYRDILPELFEAYEQGRMHDTQVRAQLIDIATRGLQYGNAYSLSGLVKQHFDIDISASKKGEDAWRLRYNELDPWPTHQWPQEAVDYAIEDALWAYKVYLEQSQTQYSCRGELIASRDGVANEQLQTMAAFAFGLMSAWGLRVDIDWAREIEQKYLGVQEAINIQLKSFGLMRPEGTMNKEEVQRVFAAAFQSFGQPPRMTKPSTTFPEGQIATDKFARTALEDLYDEDPNREMDPRFRLLRISNKLKVFLSTYIEPMTYAHPYPVCTRYGLVASGRSSSSKPNLQNLPKRDIPDDPFKASDIRRSFIPREGNVFIDADYSTLELRTLAQVCLNLGFNSRMAEALNNGRDLHTDFAAQLLGQDYQTVKHVLDHLHADANYKTFKKQRQIAKIANFGLPGGLGARGFVLYARGFGTKIDPMQSAALRDAWRVRWPEMEFYFDWIKQCELPDGNYGVPQHGPMRNIHNWRTRCCTKRSDKSPYNAACNTPFQGMAADGCKLALWKIVKACYVERDSPLYGFRPNVFVHDQFLIEGPEERASDAAYELERLMIAGMNIMVPDIPNEAGVAVGRRWDVDMETVKDQNGQYLVWEGRDA